MLLDLTKELMHELGITLVGDVIAILKHAKVAYRQVSAHTAPKWPQTAPKRPKAAPNDPKLSQNGLKQPQNGLKLPQNSQRLPQVTPNCPKMAKS